MNPPQITTNPPGGVEGDVALSMKADDGHKFWLGNYNITLGLAKRSVKVCGNIAAMLGLLPALQPAFTRYEAYLKKARAPGLLVEATEGPELAGVGEVSVAGIAGEDSSAFPEAL